MNPFRLALGLTLLLASAIGPGCSTGKPCHEAGDLDNLPAIKGNLQCTQKQTKDGKYVNHGRFIKWHPNGQAAIVGDFEDGEKTGTWFFYDEKGKKTAERFYEHGVEKSAR